MDRIGKRVKKYREENGITQAKLAEITGLSPNYISAIETGNKTPKLETFIAIANKLQISADYLLMDSIERCDVLKVNEISNQTKDLNANELQIMEDMVKALRLSLLNNRKK